MSDKIIYGIKNVHYAKKTVSEAGVVSFATPVAIPGAYELAMTATGETGKVFADNITYVKLPVNQGYEGNLGCYNLPEAFLKDILGMAEEDGVLVEKADAVISEFALLGEFNTDAAETKRWVLYNCISGRPEFGSSTKEENITAKQLSLPITATPLEDGSELVRAICTGSSTDTKWNNWFDSVFMPSASV